MNKTLQYNAHTFYLVPPLGVHIDYSNSNQFPFAFSITFFMQSNHPSTCPTYSLGNFFQHDPSALEKHIIYLGIAHIVQMSVWHISFSNLFYEQHANNHGMLIIPLHSVSSP